MRSVACLPSFLCFAFFFAVVAECVMSMCIRMCVCGPHTFLHFSSCASVEIPFTLLDVHRIPFFGYLFSLLQNLECVCVCIHKHTNCIYSMYTNWYSMYPIECRFKLEKWYRSTALLLFCENSVDGFVSVIIQTKLKINNFICRWLLQVCMRERERIWGFEFVEVPPRVFLAKGYTNRWNRLKDAHNT